MNHGFFDKNLMETRKAVQKSMIGIGLFLCSVELHVLTNSKRFKYTLCTLSYEVPNLYMAWLVELGIKAP